MYCGCFVVQALCSTVNHSVVVHYDCAWLDMEIGPMSCMLALCTACLYGGNLKRALSF